jgi:hypothetical protein
VCDYPAANEVHAPWVQGLISGRHRAKLTPTGPVGYATRGYCCWVHRELGENGQLAGGRQVEEELARLPELADGHEIGEQQ